MECERHGEIQQATDLVVVAIGPNRTAVMAALRGPMGLTPRGVGELVRAGTPITIGQVHALDVETVEAHLELCGATTERWVRYYCGHAWTGQPDEDGARAAVIPPGMGSVR